VQARTRAAFERAVGLAVEVITHQDALVWFAHVGYAPPAQDN